MLRPRPLARAIAAALLVLAACGPDKVATPPTTHAPGTPTGDPFRGTVDETGGNVSSRDGGLVVALPAGATTTPLEITVTEITNTAPNGIGKAYRLGPEGKRFSAPVALIFSATDPNIAISDLTVATQDPTGYWVRLSNVRRDPVAQTIVATTTHFSDWALVFAPSDRDLSGVFRIASTRDGVVANGVSRFYFESGDEASNYYLQSGRITVETPISRPGATCQTAVATKDVGPNIGEIHSDPSRFIWGAAGIWDVACTPTEGGPQTADFASVVFENLGINYPRCTRNYLTTPLVQTDEVQASYQINCGAEGTITADWHFQKCVPGEPCQTANPCKTAAINCDAGLPQCIENGNLTNGTVCDVNPTAPYEVCGDGNCNVCRLDEACTPTNNCHVGQFSCDTGFEVCTDTGAFLANGTVCGTNQVCFTGTCVACTAGTACTTNPNPCVSGVTDCSTGQEVCIDTATPIANGTTCGLNQVCFNSACVACTAGTACTDNPNNCVQGTTSCATGQSVCVDTATAIPNGTTCGLNQVCFNSACVACTAGTACPDNANKCVQGTTSCATGQELCLDTATLIPNGTTCGTNQVCNNGVCNACTAGNACTTNPNPCVAGTTSCATGVETCVNTTTNITNGTSCGTNQVCNGGSCVACTEGLSCNDNPNRCKEGTTSCDTGVSTCVDTGTNIPNGTTCGTDQVCNGGTCSTCVAAQVCMTNPDPCLTGITSCTTGTSLCLDNAAAPEPNGTICGTNQVCNGGTCSACTAEVACGYNQDPCVDGVTSCATGSETCENTATPRAAGTVCGVNLVCNGSGACNPCTAGVTCIENADPCLTGITSCTTGTSLCVDNAVAPEPNGTSCGQDLVCNSGSCTSCVANALCDTNPNPCVDGVTSCATGTQQCLDTATAKPNGTTCGTNAVCSTGVCSTCVDGVSCTTNTNPCLGGITSCTTGSQVCVDDPLTPEANGTICGPDQVCNGGVCGACTAGLTCAGNPNPCFAGTTSCTTGTSVCIDSGTVLADGTGCGPDLVCNAGVCSPCTAGLACATNPDPCKTGITSCSTGTSVCGDNAAAPEPNGTTCGSNQVCNGGTCTTCVAGQACTDNPDPCLAGTTSCSTGTSVCVNTATPEPSGTSCGTNQVCNGGACVACTAGGACTTNPNPCVDGSFSCATGSQTCDNTATNKPAGTTCGTNLVCNGSGACVACTAGADCTPANSCTVHETSCATGSQTCVDTFAQVANGTICGTNQVCSGGVCSACTAGQSCTTNPNLCLVGTTSCSTGTQQCIDTTTQVVNGTSCGTNQVCNAGACVACAGGAACTTNPNPCVDGVESCDTGALTCTNTTTQKANGTSCGTDQVCNGGACVACTAGAACTTNPNICLAGVTSCATGTQTCDNGTTPANEGATCGPDQVCQSGACMRVITGTRLVTRWTTSGTCSAAAPCTAITVAPDVVSGNAFVEAIGTDGTRYPGSFSPTGSFSIPNVPPGPYTLAFSSGAVTHFIQTSSTTVDLGYDVLGREATLATLPTAVTISASALSGWIESDEVQLAAPEVDLWDAPISGAEIVAGEINGSVVEDWSASSVGRSLSLLAATDVVWMHQLATSTVTDAAFNAYAYQAATRSAATAVAPDMANGSAAGISATLAPISETGTLVIDWRPAQFEALLASMGPGAQAAASPHALAVRTLPYAVASPAPPGTGAPELFRLVRPAGSADVNLTALNPPIVYGQFLDAALWSEWRDARFTARVSYTAPGAATPIDVLATISRREPMLPTPSSPIVPELGTVQGPLVNGVNALGALGAVGPTPTISWSAPGLGAPSSYRVVLRELFVGTGGASASSVVATFTTTGGSFTVPAGVLVSGRTYFAEITARTRAAEQFATAPNRTTAAGSDASTLTSTFTP